MKTIIASHKMFTYKTIIYVIEDEDIIEIKNSNLDNMTDDVIELSNKYDIKSINIKGNKKFSEKFKKDLFEIGLSNYNKEFNINLIK